MDRLFHSRVRIFNIIELNKINWVERRKSRKCIVLETNNCDRIAP